MSVDQRIVITFFIGENVSSAETHHRLQQHVEKSVSHGSVCLSGVSAPERERERAECVENELHDRQPRASVTHPSVDRADALICENRRSTIKELGAILSTQNFGKNILTPEGSTLKTDMYKEKEKKREQLKEGYFIITNILNR